ncbi:MAG: hypothetical protein ACYCZB_13505 [Acidiphilium sp.]
MLHCKKLLATAGSRAYKERSNGDPSLFAFLDVSSLNLAAHVPPFFCAVVGRAIVCIAFSAFYTAPQEDVA